MKSAIRVTSTAALVLLAAGCASAGPGGPSAASPPAAPLELEALPPYAVYGPGGQSATLDDVVEAMGGVDVVFVGEEHDDSIGHVVEDQLLQKAYARWASTGEGSPHAGAGALKRAANPRVLAVSNTWILLPVLRLIVLLTASTRGFAARLSAPAPAWGEPSRWRPSGRRPSGGAGPPRRGRWSRRAPRPRRRRRPRPWPPPRRPAWRSGPRDRTRRTAEGPRARGARAGGFAAEGPPGPAVAQPAARRTRAAVEVTRMAEIFHRAHSKGNNRLPRLVPQGPLRVSMMITPLAESG